MGAYKVEVMLHDQVLTEFVRQALADELTPAARYVAGRIVDEIPELSPHPCGHPETVRGCGGCDPGAVEFVVDDARPGVLRAPRPDDFAGPVRP